MLKKYFENLKLKKPAKLNFTGFFSLQKRISKVIAN